MDRPICTKPWTRLYVTAEGDCFNCCYQIQPIYKIGPDPESFEDAWNGKNIQFIRKVLLMGEIPSEFCDCLNKRGSIPPNDSEPNVDFKGIEEQIKGIDIPKELINITIPKNKD